MLGNSHVQFLGRSGPATGRSYPTGHAGARGAQSIDRRHDQDRGLEEPFFHAGESREGFAERLTFAPIHHGNESTRLQ